MKAGFLCMLAALVACSCGDGGSGTLADAHDVTGDDVAVDDIAVDEGEVPVDVPSEDVAMEDLAEEDVTEEPGECTESLGPLDCWEEECYFIWEGWDYLATVEGTIAAVPYSYIVIELWPTEGGPDTPGTYSFSDANYDSCPICSVVRMDCEEDCAPVYLVTAGTIQVDEMGPIGGQFSGRIVSATGIEVTIEMGTNHSTPVPGGGTICIEDLAFSTGVMEFP